jgi:hypothetical protein
VRRRWPFTAVWLAALVPWSVAACAITVPNDPVDPGSGPNPSAFVGQWTCTDTEQVTPVQPWCLSGSCTAPTQASIVEASPSTITTTFSTGTTGACVLDWAVDGNVGTLFPANQTCAVGQGKANITYTAGTIMLMGTGMATAKLMGVFSGTDLGIPVKGTGTLSASCQRH